jgi:hypothetical protein
MINSEVGEMFNQYQYAAHESTNNIGHACNHLSGMGFTQKRVVSHRPFGFAGGIDSMVLFAQIVLKNRCVAQARKTAGVSRFRAKKMVSILNTVADSRGFHPISIPECKKLDPREVICNQTGEKFPSIYAAERAVNCSRGELVKHLQRRVGSRSVKGFTFSYVRELTPEQKAAKEQYLAAFWAAKGMDVPPAGKSRKKYRRSIKVICDQTQEKFNSIRSACDKLGLPLTTVTNHLKRNSVYASPAGLVVRVYFQGKPTRKQVRCDTTGQIFNSLMEAAGTLNVSISAISIAVRGLAKSRKVKGLSFSLVS